jgi:hypothetical protein
VADLGRWPKNETTLYMALKTSCVWYCGVVFVCLLRTLQSLFYSLSARIYLGIFFSSLIFIAALILGRQSWQRFRQEREEEKIL